MFEALFVMIKKSLEYFSAVDAMFIRRVVRVLSELVVAVRKVFP